MPNEPTPSKEAMAAAKDIYKHPLDPEVPVIVTVTAWARLIDAAMPSPAAPPTLNCHRVLADLIERLRWLAAEDKAAGAPEGQESITYSDLEIDIQRAKDVLESTAPPPSPRPVEANAIANQQLADQINAQRPSPAPQGEQRQVGTCQHMKVPHATATGEGERE